MSDYKTDTRRPCPAVNRRHWIFRHPCGCPFGVMDDAENIPTVAVAWKEFFGTPGAVGRAVTRGVTVELISDEQYVAEVYPLMLGPACTHRGSS